VAGRDKETDIRQAKGAGTSHNTGGQTPIGGGPENMNKNTNKIFKSLGGMNGGKNVWCKHHNHRTASKRKKNQGGQAHIGGKGSELPV